jgi:threonine/homoserine/homoserine lactone efflux protein
MFSGIKIYFAGLLISFLGSLPLGTLNITATQIAVEENNKKAISFAIGAAIVELIYVRLSLKGIDFILANQLIFFWLEWATVAVFTILAISSCYAAAKPAANQKNILLNNKINRFWLGISMSAINPVQIPFWFLWSGYLFSIHWLTADTGSFNIYTAGIATGTMAGLLLFIYGGKWLLIKLKTGQKLLHLIVAIVFFLSAIIQLIRILNKPIEKRLAPTSFKTERLPRRSAYSAFRLSGFSF